MNQRSFSNAFDFLAPFKFVSSNISKGVLCINKAGRIIFSNEGATHIFSFSENFSGTTTLFDFVPELSFPDWEKTITELKRKKTTHLTLDLILSNGRSLKTNAPVFIYTHGKKEYIFLIIETHL